MITYKYLNLYYSLKLYIFLKNNIDLYFKPHKFNYITVLKNIFSKDIFIIQMVNNKVIGYGMLRGWNEGFDIPSLGIMIDKNHRGMGLSRHLMNYLHKVAKEKKSNKIMLKVYKNNTIAVNLYRSLGYDLKDYNEDLLIGFKKLK